MRSKHPREYRASTLIRGMVLSALLLWAAAGIFAAWIGGFPASALVSIAFFVLFFLGFAAYFWRMSCVVDEHGVTIRGALDQEHLAWEDIEQVRDSQLPLGGYWITTKRGVFVLNTFIQEREQLLDIIVARAGLFPEAAH